MLINNVYYNQFGVQSELSQVAPFFVGCTVVTFSKEELAKEKSQYHLVALHREQVIGVCLLNPCSQDEVKLRQFAIASAYQSRGIGKKLLHFAEKIAHSRGFRRIVLHARKEAMGFYLKETYQTVGGEFEEVGIPHFKMIKEW